MGMDVTQIEKAIGYVFKDKSLLINAMTHASYANEHAQSESYDRLEFLGDGILDFLVAEQLFFASVRNEGEMTVKRSRMVSKHPLCEAVVRMDIYKYVRFGKGAENNEFISEKAKSDIFESILAAIYIDSGSIEKAREFIRSHLNNCISLSGCDYKSKLQEYAQARKITLEYPRPEQYGSANRPFFKARAVLGEIEGVGQGASIKEAQQNAARMVCENLNIVTKK